MLVALGRATEVKALDVRKGSFQSEYASRWALEAIDLIAAAVIVALRRADEMGDAITARGGAGQISAAPTGPKRRDWVALSIVVAVCGVALALELTLLGTT